MKYGVLFTLAGILIAAYGGMKGGWWLLCLWPAASFVIVGLGYFWLGPRVYGKRSNGVVSPVHMVILLPYLVYMWAVWYLARVVKREAAYDRLTDNLIIGRRLLSHELPDNVDVVVDLTCEFTEPEALRQKEYYSFQILDGYVPPIDSLVQWAKEVSQLSGTIYIHCAEGHGRTGLFAAALLLRSGQAASADEALTFIQSKRPLVRLGRRQRRVLEAVHENDI